MTHKDMNDATALLASATMILDRLQVELCKYTPYEIPSAEKTRERILSSLADLEKLWSIISTQKCVD